MERERKVVLVIGATGLLGQPVSQRLEKAGFTVRVMGRSTRRLEQIFPSGFELVEGDVSDVAGLEQNMAGCFGVHISLPSDAGEAAGTRHIIEAAKRSSVERVSFVSGTTVCEEHSWFPLVKEKLEAESIIQAAGIPFVLFRPTWFMEVLPNFVKRSLALCIGSHPSPYHLLAADDFGEMVARYYQLDQAPNTALQVRGPESVRLPVAIRRYCEVLRPGLRMWTLPFWFSSFVATMRRSEQMKWAVKFAKYFQQVGEGPFTPLTTELLGEPTITLDKWLERRRASS